MRIGVDLETAVVDALRHYSDWMNGAVVVRFDDGSYEAMGPLSARGSSGYNAAHHIEETILEITDAVDLLGPDAPNLSEATDKALAEWANWLIEEDNLDRSSKAPGAVS